MSKYSPASNVGIQEISVPKASSAATAARTYRITSASMWTRKFKVKSQPTNTVVYTLKFTSSLPNYTVVLSNANPPATIAAAAKVSLLRSTTHVAVGDPTSTPDRCQKIEMTLDSMWKHNQYAVPLKLRDGRQVQMQWRGTNQVEGFMKKMDSGLHHKLMEIGEGGKERLLARYIHDSWSMDVAGSVEIFAVPEGLEDWSWEGGWWDAFVLMAAVAVAEKTIKLVLQAM